MVHTVSSADLSPVVCLLNVHSILPVHVQYIVESVILLRSDEYVFGQSVSLLVCVSASKHFAFPLLVHLLHFLFAQLKPR